jgi:hypothetical protein
MITCRSMIKFSSIFVWLTAPASICLELMLFYFAFRRRLYRQLVFFSIYIFIVTVQDLVGLWISYSSWYSAIAWNETYWSVQFVLSLLRLLTIAEIARRSMRGYPAIWAFTWRILSVAAVILLFWTTYSAAQNVHHFRKFIAGAGQRFEFMQAVLLLLLLLLGAYYRMRISPLFRLILIGICIYSAVQVANNQFLLVRSVRTDAVFDYVRRGSFLISFAIWTYAVWRWGATPDVPPKLVSQAKYEALSPQIHDRLRELNDRLAKFSRRPPR